MASASGIQALATGADNEIRMILLGRTGAGKSSLGNTILGNKHFKSGICPVGITKACCTAVREFENKRLFVVDTPGFLDPSITDKEVQIEVGKAYELTAVPGPHAFLLVFDLVRMTEQENQAAEYLSKIFGPDAINRTIIIFTHGDELDEEDSTIEQYLSGLTRQAPLKILLEKCKQRYLCFNNKAREEKKNESISILLKQIADMSSRNDNKVYKSELFAAVAKEIEYEKALGAYQPLRPDGSYVLLPQTKALVIDGYLRRTVGRSA